MGLIRNKKTNKKGDERDGKPKTTTGTDRYLKGYL